MSFGISGSVVKVLNHVLGSFIEDIDQSQFDLSVFSGKVALRNISVRSSVFENLPIPFKLVYGKVGKIDVDVPVLSLFSSPLKIKIEDVFILVNPMETSEWQEEKEIACFRSAVQSSLSHLEEYFDSKEEIEKSDPGMLTKMLSNIVDNLQVEISNICIRYEDPLSNPKMPFCMGITIKNLRTFTANDKWEKEFVTKKDVCNKSLQLNNFSMFLNFHDNIFYDDIMNEFGPDDLSKEERAELSKKDSKTNTELAVYKYKHFIALEAKNEFNNSYLLKNFCIEAHLKLNKNPKSNNLPQIDLNLVFGGEFEKGGNKVANTKGQTFDIQFQQQQLIAVLKFLEYSGYYTKYQANVLKPFYENDFSKKEAEEYIDLYVNFRRQKDEAKGKDVKKAEDASKKLKRVEQDY